MLGGTLDLYFLSGPDPKSVIEQYSDVVGKPAWQPMWGFGFHLCRYVPRYLPHHSSRFMTRFSNLRWGYTNLSEVQEQVDNMRAANVPLESGSHPVMFFECHSLTMPGEAMWNDIDVYHSLRDFTSDPISYPGDQMRDFIRNLVRLTTMFAR